MKSRSYYEKLFADYPDVLTEKQFKAMLGGMNDKLIYKILSDNMVKHFRIGRTLYIPKIYAIDYAMSEHYAEFTKRHKIRRGGERNE